MSRTLFIARSADRIDHGPRFVDSLLVFARRIGVGHDPSAGLEVSASPLQHDGAECYATIERAVESEVTDRSGVTTALPVFELADDLHRANLRSPGDRAGGKRRP